LLKMLSCQPIYRGNKKKNRIRQRAFTLTELLITVTIFAVVSLAIYATFNSGMTVWRRAKDTNTEQRKFLLKTEKLSRELRQAFSFNDIAFSATKSKIQFPSVIDSDICRITYFFDANKKILYRSCDKLADILAQDKKKLEPNLSSYLPGIDNVSFYCLVFDLQKKSYVWKEDWQQVNLPVAVKVNITTKDKHYAATIIIPSA